MQTITSPRHADASPLADTLVVLDFETSGLSPTNGDRAIEIGAVLLENGVITARYQSLINPGFRINNFIASYTGISNDMLSPAPASRLVMAELATFLGDHNVVAHNASFDKRFLDAEFGRIGHRHRGEFVCSMLVARRLYPHAHNHKLGTLVGLNDIANDGTFHRALADAEMTARLWTKMISDLRSRFSIDVPSFDLLRRLSRQPVRSVERLFETKDCAAKPEVKQCS